MPTVVLAVEANEATVSMTFPAPTRCALPEGTLKAFGTLRLAGRAPEPLIVTALEHDERTGEVNVQLAFTPPTAGVGDLQVFVDPQLGIAQVPVLVARDGAKLPFTDVSAPCSAPQQTSSGVLVCGEPSGDAGVSLWTDGRLLGSLPGALHPQVVGDLLWTHRFDDAGLLLERSVVSADGGVTVTHAARVGGFRPPTPRYADAARLMRLGLVATTLDDGGLEVSNAHQASVADVMLAEPDRAWAWISDRWCAADGGCLPRVSGAKVAGIEPSVWWEQTSGQLVVHRRPVADAGSIASVPVPSARPVTARPAVNGTRRARLNDPRGLFFFEWEPDGGAITLTRFPDWTVAEENAETVSFSLAGGVVRFVRLR